MRTAVKYVTLFLLMSVFLASCGREKAETVLLKSGEEDSAAEKEAPADEAAASPVETQVIQVVCNCNCTAGQSARTAVSANDAGGAAQPAPVEASAAPAPSDDGKVNINTADAVQLQTLNGIGATRAQDIISYREANGTFQTIEDIKNVPGIKDGIYNKIKDNISV